MFRTSDDRLTKRINLKVTPTITLSPINLDYFSSLLYSGDVLDLIVYADILQSYLESNTKNLLNNLVSFDQLEEYYMKKEAWGVLTNSVATCQLGYRCLEPETCLDGAVG